MSDDVWSAEDTNPEEIEAALRELLRERHAANPSLAPARVLNLVVVADREWKGEVANRLERVGRYHASRTLLCTVEPGRRSLSATAVMSYGEPGEGPGVIHEQVEIDVGPSHLERLDTIVDPVLVSELPTMLWSPHGHADAVERLGGMIDVMLLDSDDVDEPADGLARAAMATESAYVVDLAWLRTTPWRERLAASFDPPIRRARLACVNALSVRHKPGSGASALLLCGWLASRLGWEPSPLEGDETRCLRGRARCGGREIAVELQSVDQDAPGLVGVTIDDVSGFSLSLDRASGGLCARQRAEDGTERVWQVLGASRGEGGILGEGVRQALLRDPTYGPALSAARELCPR